ncbi:MAG: prolyl oligopeptidase family serine peptidase, partial [Lachnospiraceae bacterium]|nr:prolyl oligopeptidase family serine peptidase [Lachnospiraceae bacterium]
MGRGVRFLIINLMFGCTLMCSSCGHNAGQNEVLDTEVVPSESSVSEETSAVKAITGNSTYRGFVVDNILPSETLGDIHYNVYIPDDYDGKEAYALYFTLPGYQGLYFQGVAQNIKTEEFGFEALKYNDKMIVVAPQLNDWGETSTDQTIELVEYFLNNYNIDKTKVYASGYSGGGETMSRVLGKRPDLFCAYLHCSSKWDGDYDVLVESRTPVYIVIGEADEYYGSQLSQEAYENIRSRYETIGVSEDEISEWITLDIKDTAYFENGGVTNQHGGGGML